MSVEIWVALIGLGGVIYASTVGVLFQYGKRKLQAERDLHRLEVDEREREHIQQLNEEREKERKKQESSARLRFQREVKNPYIQLNRWQPIADRIELLCESSPIDRVLILVAINGEVDPTHATVVWDYRQKPYKERYEYVDVRLDADYQRRLMQTGDSQYIRFKTEEAANTLIGSYYASEGVKEAVWLMLGRRNAIETEQVAYKYMSFATHGEIEFSTDHIRKMVNIASDIKSVIYTSGFTPPM